MAACCAPFILYIALYFYSCMLLFQSKAFAEGPILRQAEQLRTQVQDTIAATASSHAGAGGGGGIVHHQSHQSHQAYHPHSNAHPLHGGVHHIITNDTLAGTGLGCVHTTQYTITNNGKFFMCTGQSDIDLKNGMSIINLVGSRGYLPTCRIMHLMLWMHSIVNEENMNRKKGIVKDYFIDVGANIGSCSVHMAALGLPVVSVEPVIQHVNTIRGSADINPSFHIDVQHIGISSEEKVMKVDFGHGSRNWGATAFWEKQGNQSFETELIVKTLDQVIGHKKVALLKIDCEGCEWNAIKGGRRSLKRVPMIKIELVQPEYQSGNETVSAHDIVKHLGEIGFDLFVDVWNEQHLYFGKGGNDIMDIDRMFGSSKFNLKADVGLLHQSAKKIMESEIDPKTWDHRKFLKSYTDVIAIEKSISSKMKKLWLSQFNMR